MIRIVTDSTCDITTEEAKELGIEIIPLTIQFEDSEFYDGVDITKKEFYDKLRKCSKLPVTSQVSPLVFEELFEKYSALGDEIVGIFISSELSGTFQSANIAASGLDGDNIHLVDSKNVSIGTAVLVREAVRMRNMGMEAKAIADECCSLRECIQVVAMVDSLKYLKMGGRLSQTSAMVGTLLHINPIISIVQGKVEVVGKSRGVKSAYSFMINYIKEHAIDKAHTFIYGNADAPEAMADFEKRSSEYTQTSKVCYGEIGAVVGTHLGPGAVGVAYIAAAEEGICTEKEFVCA